MLPRLPLPLFRSTNPALALVLGLLVSLLGPGCGEDQVAQQPLNPDMVRGHQLYVTHCLACHQAQGQGLEVTIPPLAANATVSGPADRLIRIVLHGLAGPIEVEDRTYEGVMQGLSRLSDQEVALLLTYIRQQWGNQAGPVNVDEVAQIRSTHRQRIEPWTVEELDQLRGE